MQIQCFEIDERGHLNTAEYADAIERWRAGDGPFWVDIEEADPSARGRVLAEVGLDRDFVDELLKPGHAPRVLPLDDATFFEFPTGISGDPLELKSVSIVCFDRLVVTLRASGVGESAERIGSLMSWVTLDGRSISELVCALFVGLSIELRGRSSELRQRTVTLSRRMDADPEAVELQEIIGLKNDIVDLDAVAEERAAVMETLEPIKHPTLDLVEFADQYRVALGNTVATSRRLDRLDRRAADLQSRYDAQQQEKMNRRLSRLTIISAIFLPLTLLAGIYGMNFDVMPELHWPLGYPLVMGGMVLVAVGMVWWFRVRGWMD